MGQHRKTKHYRRIVVTAAAVGAVGVPSVALACSEWPYGTDDPAQTTATSAPVGQWQYAPKDHDSNGSTTGAPLTVTPETSAPPAPRATTRPTTRPSTPWQAKKHGPAHKKKAVTHKVWRTTAPGAPEATAPAPAATAPSSAAPAPTSAAPAAPSSPAPTATASGVTGEILRLVNAERSKAGCQPLTLNSTLTKAAQAHSDDMAAHQNMSHTGSDGSSPGDRITRAGYTWSSYGENVAYGYSTADQVMAGWMSSPGHRANILNCGFKEIGVGLAQPGSYWTQDFGTAR
ncbi:MULTISPECIES: CAP domain-containing protein [Streptomyces]|uniref:CAP domain-containing protein n=1 Tax=Streptomyces flaveolus TaxID=67297 RepID=A0ABV3A8V9_9ACTN|nr:MULTISPECIES: CAP domain-containing protein [Streptomyces]KMS88213.1 lipoprotein [Streptomyces regensis]KOG74127.1 lipoprotein [Streptomyces antibioticus]